MTETDASPGARGLRMVVLVAAGIEVVLFGGVVLLFVANIGSSDPLARGIASGVAKLVAIPLVALALPALVLGVIGRWLRLALALAILAVPAAVAIYVFM